MSQKKNGFQYNNLFLVSIPGENKYVVANSKKDAVAHLGPLTSELAIREEFDPSTLKTGTVIDIRVDPDESIDHKDKDYIIGLDLADGPDKMGVAMFEVVEGGELALIADSVTASMEVVAPEEVSAEVEPEPQPETTEAPQPKQSRKKKAQADE